MAKLVFWAIVLIAIMVLGRRLGTYFFNNAQIERSVPVLVVDEQTREFMGQTRKQQTEMPAPRVNYYVTFRPLKSPDPQQFQVSKPIYEQLMPEQTGTLVFKGSRFIAFEPELTTPDND